MAVLKQNTNKNYHLHLHENHQKRGTLSKVRKPLKAFVVLTLRFSFSLVSDSILSLKCPVGTLQLMTKRMKQDGNFDHMNSIIS